MKARALLVVVPVLGCGSGAKTTASLSTTVSATTGVSETGGASSSGSEGEAGTVTTGRLDTPAGDGTGGDPCAICEEAEFSYIWVANSPESTVSKINTRTLQEEGRYLTRPDGNGNPSRTSVSIDGNAVAVANRNSGLIKIWARPELCDSNANGQPGLQTSTGSSDVLAWGEDDCVAWYTAFDTPEHQATVQRPVAWTPGTFNEETCEYDDQKIWTVTGRLGTDPAQCGASGLYVHLVDGATGAVDQTVHIPESEMSCLFGTSTFGIGGYAAAVDFEGDLWFHVHGQQGLMEVRLSDLTYQRVGSSQYGLTVDTSGRVWAAGSGVAYRYDQMTGVTDQVFEATGFSGIAEDLQGRMWVGSGDFMNPTLLGFDSETMVVVETIPLPGTDYVKGVSVDVDGFIWAVLGNDTRAFRIDPTDLTDIQFYDGLDQPYTYSDMTGGQISNVTCNPPVD